MKRPWFRPGYVSNRVFAIFYILRRWRGEAREQGLRRFRRLLSGVQLAARIDAYFRLGAIFDKLPPAGGQLPFEDDSTKDVQIVARPGAETVILLFCGRTHELGIPLDMVHRLFGLRNASLIYLRDFQTSAYLHGVRSLGADRDATLVALRRLVVSIGGRRILCYGTSGGAFAALRYGIDLDAEAVLSMSGATNLSLKFNTYSTWIRQAKQLSGEMPETMLDMRALYAAAAHPPRVRIVYGQDYWDDRIQAEHMGGLPCVTLHPIDNYAEHNSTLELIMRGQIEDVLDWLVPPAGPSK